MVQRRKTGYLPTLDGLRGLASLCVVVHHIGQQLDLKHSFHHGYLAVPFFFVLSGFVVARSYENGLRSGALSFRKFTEIRALRLFPMICISAFVAFLLTRDWEASILTFFVIPSLIGSTALFPLNGPEWSLFLELIGNAAHAIISRHLTNLILAGLICLSSTFVVINAFNDHSVNVGWGYRTLFSGTWLFISTYSIGIMIARLETKGKLFKIHIPAPVLLAFFLIVMAWPSHPNTMSYTVRDLSTSVVIFPVVVMLATQSRSTPMFDKIAQKVGDISYPLYITHVPIIAALAAVMRRHQLNVANRYECAPLIFAGCIAIAWLFLTFLDRPIRKALSLKLGIGRSQPSAGPA